MRIKWGAVIRVPRVQLSLLLPRTHHHDWYRLCASTAACSLALVLTLDGLRRQRFVLSRRV